MTSEVRKSENLRSFLKSKKLENKFDTEVKRWNPGSFHKKRFDNIIGSFRFSHAEDGSTFWEAVNDEYESIAGN